MSLNSLHSKCTFLKIRSRKNDLSFLRLEMKNMETEYGTVWSLLWVKWLILRLNIENLEFDSSSIIILCGLSKPIKNQNCVCGNPYIAHICNSCSFKNRNIQTTNNIPEENQWYINQAILPPMILRVLLLKPKYFKNNWSFWML